MAYSLFEPALCPGPRDRSRRHAGAWPRTPSPGGRGSAAESRQHKALGEPRRPFLPLTGPVAARAHGQRPLLRDLVGACPGSR